MQATWPDNLRSAMLQKVRVVFIWKKGEWHGGVLCVLYIARVAKLTWFPGKRDSVFTFPGEGGWNEYTRVG